MKNKYIVLACVNGKVEMHEYPTRSTAQNDFLVFRDVLLAEGIKLNGSRSLGTYTDGETTTLTLSPLPA